MPAPAVRAVHRKARAEKEYSHNPRTHAQVRQSGSSSVPLVRFGCYPYRAQPFIRTHTRSDALSFRLHLSGRHVQLPAARDVIAHLRNRWRNFRGGISDAFTSRLAAIRLLAVSPDVPAVYEMSVAPRSDRDIQIRSLAKKMPRRQRRRSETRDRRAGSDGRKAEFVRPLPCVSGGSRRLAGARAKGPWRLRGIVRR